jgi:hypothetical protein
MLSSSFYSPALLAVKRKVIEQQAAQLRRFVDVELGPIVSLRTVDGWRDLPRLTDPAGQADQFNDNHVVTDLSCAVPGLLGVFALSDAYPPGCGSTRTANGRVRLSAPPSPNVGYYYGFLMLSSEYTFFNKVYSHSMGVILSGIKGRDPHIDGSAEEGVILVGDPNCTVVQALHNTRAPNCVLTSRVQAGDKLVSTKVGQGGQALPFDSIVLQAQKIVHKGDELTFSYAPHWEHTTSCVVCCFSVTKDELSEGQAFQCLGFIDGSPCCFSLHRDCATDEGFDYCPYCGDLSGLDDLNRTPKVWLDAHVGVSTAGDPSAGRSTSMIITTASFAAALRKAITLGWTITSAEVLPPQHVSEECKQEEDPTTNATTKGATSRVIGYHCSRSSASPGPPHPMPPFRVHGPVPLPSSPPFVWPPPIAGVHSPTVTPSTLPGSSEGSLDGPGVLVSELNRPEVGTKETKSTVERVVSRSGSESSVWSFAYSEADRVTKVTPSTLPGSSEGSLARESVGDIPHPQYIPPPINILPTAASKASSMPYTPAWRLKQASDVAAQGPSHLDRTDVHFWAESQRYLTLTYQIPFERRRDAEYALAIQGMLESQVDDCPPVDCNNLSDCMRRIHDVGMAFVIAFLNALLLEWCSQQLPPFEDGCYWWCMAEGMEKIIHSLFQESRLQMEGWLEHLKDEQASRVLKWQRLLDDDTHEQEREWRSELAQVIDHCYGPGSKNPHDRTVIYAPAVLVALRLRAKRNEAEWRPYILTIRSSHPYGQDVDGILYRMLRMWLKEVVVQLEQQCSTVWIGDCPARMSPLLSPTLQSPMQSVINNVGRSDQWMQQAITEVVEQRSVQLLPSRPSCPGAVDVVAALQYLWYSVYRTSQQAAVDKVFNEVHQPPTELRSCESDALSPSQSPSTSSATVHLRLQPSYSSPPGLPLTSSSLNSSNDDQSSDLEVVELASVQYHPPSSPLVMTTTVTAYQDTISPTPYPPSVSTPLPAIASAMTSQLLSIPPMSPVVPPLPPSSLASMSTQSSPQVPSITSPHEDADEAIGESQPSQLSSASSSPGLKGGMAATAGTAAAADDDMDWEDVPFEDERAAAAERRRYQQRERSIARKRWMTDSTVDESSSDSEWTPDTDHQTTQPTVPFSSSSSSSSSSSYRASSPSFVATVNPFSPPPPTDAEEKHSEGMDASLPLDAAAAVGVVPQSLHTQTNLAYSNLPRRDAVPGGGVLSAPARRACEQLRRLHLAQCRSHAAQQSTKSKLRKGQLSASGQRRLSERVHLQRDDALPDHCKRGLCDIDAFGQRLEFFINHCGAKYRHQVDEGILSGKDRVVWEARLQRLKRVETYPERMFKVQLDSSNKTYNHHRTAFWQTYNHLSQRGSQARSQALPGPAAGHESMDVDDDVSLDGSATAHHRTPLPPSTIPSESASTSSSSSSSSPRTCMGNEGHSATLSSDSDITPAHAAATLELNYEGIPLCLRCYIRVYPFLSGVTLADWVLRIVRGKGYYQSSTQSATGEHGNRLRGGSTAHPMTTATNLAIRHLALARGDAAPNSNTTMLVERSYQQLTNRVNVQVEAETGRKVSVSLVRKVMKAEPHIKLNGRVASVPECNQCCNFKLNPSPTDLDREKHETHLQIQQGERSMADLHCKKAVSNPNDYLTIFMDGMDQAKTAVPHLSSQKPKWLDGITPWKVHVTGVMAFGPQKTFAYLNYDHIKSCAALSIHVLDDVLRRLWEYIGNEIAGRPQPKQPEDDIQDLPLPKDGEEKDGGSTGDVHHHLSSSSSTPAAAAVTDAVPPAVTAAPVQRPPPKDPPPYTRYPENLYLVMDNSAKDNKNNAVFRYLALLVKRGIFKTVQVNFLLVGHTHDRVDQFFSCISRQLSREDAWTPAELRRQIRAGYTVSKKKPGASEEEPKRFQGDLTIDSLCRERPLVVVLDEIMEWSLWLDRGGISVPRKPSAGAARSPTTVVGQRLDSSLLPHGLEEATVDREGDNPSAESNSESDANATQDRGDPLVSTINTGDTGPTHGLPVFCGRIKSIKKPQVFRFTMNLMQEVVVRVQPSSYTLDVQRTPEGKLQFKLQPVELQAPVVLMSADAPVPYIDPIPLPPQPFPHDSLLDTYNTMLCQASASFTLRRQREWSMELERVSLLLEVQSHCARCEELQASISSIKVATGRKQQRMTEEQQVENNAHARRRSGLKTELSRHLSTGHQPLEGIWTRPWQPCCTDFLDPVQVLIPGRVSKELAMQDSQRRQLLHYQQREGHVELLHKFILDSTLSSTDRMRFEHALEDQSSTALISVESTKAARTAAASAAEASLGVDITEREGQDRRIPIQVGDIVAVSVDNYCWPEYPISIALVVGVTPPAKGRKRGRAKPKAKAKKGKQDVTSQSKRRCSRRGASEGVGAATAPGTDHQSSSSPLDPVQEEDQDQDGKDQDTPIDREEFDKTQLQVVFYYIRYPSHAHATRILDAKVEHYKGHGDKRTINGCLDKALTLFRMKRCPKKASQPRLDSRSLQSSGEDNESDAAYLPASEEEEKEDPLLEQRRKMGRRETRRRARLAAQQEGQSSLSTPPVNSNALPLSANDEPSLSSSSSSSSSSPSSARPSGPFQSHPPFSSHFVWTTGAPHLPATWWKVFTEVNGLFEAAKPDARVLRRLAPWFSVLDLEMEQLGMVLLPPAQRITQLVLQEEVMCWDQAHLVLTKDGYFTQEFAIKLHNCLNLAHSFNGGYYGDDRDSDNEAQSEMPDSAHSSAHSHQPARGRQPVVREEGETKEQLPAAAAATLTMETSQSRPTLPIRRTVPGSTIQLSALEQSHSRRATLQQRFSSSSSFPSHIAAATSPHSASLGQLQAPVVSSQQSTLRTPHSVSRGKYSDGYLGNHGKPALGRSSAVSIPSQRRPLPPVLSTTPLVPSQDDATTRFISLPPSPPFPSSISTTAVTPSSFWCTTGGTPMHRLRRAAANAPPPSVIHHGTGDTSSSTAVRTVTVTAAAARSGPGDNDSSVFPNSSSATVSRSAEQRRSTNGMSYAAGRRMTMKDHHMTDRRQGFSSSGRLATRPPRVSAVATPPIWSYDSHSNSDNNSDGEASEEIKEAPSVSVGGWKGVQSRQEVGAIAAAAGQVDMLDLTANESDQDMVEEDGVERKERGPVRTMREALSAVVTERNLLLPSIPHPRPPPHQSLNPFASVHVQSGRRARAPADVDSTMKVQLHPGLGPRGAASSSMLASNPSSIHTSIHNIDDRRRILTDRQSTPSLHSSSMAPWSSSIEVPPASIVRTGRHTLSRSAQPLLPDIRCHPPTVSQAEHSSSRGQL